MISFRDFKERISIIQVAEAIGYEVDLKKGKVRLQYEHANGDKVIISNINDPGKQLYFNRNGSDDKGDLIQFIKNRLNLFNVYYNKPEEGINKVLSKFANEEYNYQQRLENLNVHSTTHKHFDKSNYLITTPSIKDLMYLQSTRALSESTIEKFLPFISLVQDKNSSYNYKNIGFPYHVPGDDKIVGFELRNYSYRGHATGSDKTNAVWQAHFGPSPKLTENIFFAESAIDAMSFYQIYRQRFNFDSAVLVSTGGALSKNQIQNTLALYENAKVHTIFDNDYMGKLFSIYTAAIKSNKEYSFIKKDDSVKITINNRIIEIPEKDLSLTLFERLTGLRTNVLAITPDAKDFNQMLKDLQSEDLIKIKR